MHNPEGVLWYRGYAQKKESAFCPSVANVLERLGAKQMVVGHNVVSKVKQLCKDTVYMIDVGMSSGVSNAQPTVWTCHQGHIENLT